MKLSSRRKRPSKKLLIVSAVVLLGLAGGGYWYWQQRSLANATPKNTTAPANTVNYGPATEQQKSTQNQQKEDLLNNTTGDGTTPAANQPTTPISVSITRAGQTAANQPVNVRTIVNGTTSGTCKMVFTKGSNTVTKTYDVSLAPTAAICNADIDIGSFNESGSWDLNVTVTNGSQTSKAAVWTLTINK